MSKEASTKQKSIEAALRAENEDLQDGRDHAVLVGNAVPLRLRVPRGLRNLIDKGARTYRLLCVGKNGASVPCVRFLTSRLDSAGSTLAMLAKLRIV